MKPFSVINHLNVIHFVPSALVSGQFFSVNLTNTFNVLKNFSATVSDINIIQDNL
jgi:hypothetical protein